MNKLLEMKIITASARKDAMAAYKRWKAAEAREGNNLRTNAVLKQYTKAWQAYQQAERAQFLYEAEND